MAELDRKSIQETEQNLELDLQEMKQKLEIDLLGIARIDDSAPKEIRDCADSLLPGAKAAVVFGKEIHGFSADRSPDRGEGQ